MCSSRAREGIFSLDSYRKTMRRFTTGLFILFYIHAPSSILLFSKRPMFSCVSRLIIIIISSSSPRRFVRTFPRLLSRRTTPSASCQLRIIVVYYYIVSIANCDRTAVKVHLLYVLCTPVRGLTVINIIYVVTYKVVCRFFFFHIFIYLFFFYHYFILAVALKSPNARVYREYTVQYKIIIIYRNKRFRRFNLSPQ